MGSSSVGFVGARGRYVFEISPTVRGVTYCGFTQLLRIKESEKRFHDRPTKPTEPGPLVALTADTAAIQSVTGSWTVCRAHNKPVFGPLGYYK
jgi:hypothetical protein